MSEFLDELARSVARPMPRSRALRLLGGALVSAAAAGVFGRGSAGASTKRGAASGCPTETCGYRPILFNCPRPGETDPDDGAPCGPPSGNSSNCCEAGERCCSDGPPGGNFPGRCTGSSEVSREGYYCCPQSCECYKGICCAPGSMRGMDKTGFPICCDRAETLCDEPQARGGVICCKKVCGPDITEELRKTISRMKSAFAGWSGAARWTACWNLVTVPFGPVSWDIVELGPGGRGKFTKKFPDCATCGYSVQVGKDCHYSGSVNYAAYGLMMRLCRDELSKDDSWIADWFSQEEMLEMIYVHKNYTGTQSANFQASNEWALAGYRSGGSGSLRPFPPGDRRECKERCSKEYAGPGFSVVWFPWKIGPRG